jgi:hypothetical protein
MLEWVSRDRDYKPKIVAAMTSAFDTVCRSLLAKESDNNDIRRKLALIILRHTDRGERDPRRLADLSFRELMGLWRRRLAHRPKSVGAVFLQKSWDGGRRAKLEEID